MGHPLTKKSPSGELVSPQGILDRLMEGRSLDAIAKEFKYGRTYFLIRTLRSWSSKDSVFADNLRRILRPDEQRRVDLEMGRHEEQERRKVEGPLEKSALAMFAEVYRKSWDVHLAARAAYPDVDYPQEEFIARIDPESPRHDPLWAAEFRKMEYEKRLRLDGETWKKALVDKDPTTQRFLLPKVLPQIYGDDPIRVDVNIGFNDQAYGRVAAFMSRSFGEGLGDGRQIGGFIAEAAHARGISATGDYDPEDEANEPTPPPAALVSV